MFSRAAKFYSGVSLPVSASWIIVVVVATFFVDHPDVAIGLGAAIVGPPVAILIGALETGEQKAGSWRAVIGPSGPRENELFSLGLKKGFVLGPISVLGVALIPASIWAVDQILTALGK